MESVEPDWDSAEFEAEVERLIVVRVVVVVVVVVEMACDCDGEDSQQVEALVGDSVQLAAAFVGMAAGAAASAVAGMGMVEGTEVVDAVVAAEIVVTVRARQLRLPPDSVFLGVQQVLALVLALDAWQLY